MAPLPRDPAGAERRLSEFLQRYPESSLADDAGLELGRIALDARRQEGGPRRACARSSTRQPDGDRSDSARVELAQLEAARGRSEVAASELARVRIAKLPPEERRVAYRVLARRRDRPRRLAALARAPAGRGDRPGADRAHRRRARPRARRLLAPPISTARRSSSAIRRRRRACSRARARARARAGRSGDGAARLGSGAPARPGRGPTPRAWRRWASASRARERGALDTADLPTFAQAAQAPSPDTAGGDGHDRRRAAALGLLRALRRGEPAGHPARRRPLRAAAPGAAVRREAADPRHRRASRAGRRGRARAGGGRRGLGDHRSAALRRERGRGRGRGCGAGAAARALLARGDRPRPQLRVPPAHDAAGGDRGAGRSHRPRPRRAALRDPVSARSLRPRRAQALLGGGRAGGRPGVAVAAYDPAANDFADPIRQLLGFSMLSPGRGVGARAARESRAARAAPAAAGRGEAARAGARDDRTGRHAAAADRRFRRALHPGVLREGRADRARSSPSTRRSACAWPAPAAGTTRICWSSGRRHVEGARFTLPVLSGEPAPEMRRSSRAATSRPSRRRPGAFAAQGYDAAQLVLLQLAQRQALAQRGARRHARRPRLPRRERRALDARGRQRAQAPVPAGRRERPARAGELSRSD